ncbi:hypothetical protein CVIRNUC_000662 [Coccomyxa viridis]|uniref:Uncharacterized protein n=1 Tax=Coccomyxa viridis TaxID=1274662 RepID=A0AAV1HTR8_9CHLO|nr:hypothetical protein CVIRNUC_000662 [Coccomyxa viridis]
MQSIPSMGHRGIDLLHPLSQQPISIFRHPLQHQSQHCSCRKSRQRMMSTIVSAEQAERMKPAYNKYRSRNDIQQSYIREWQKTTARDGNIQPQTILSTLWFVPMWMKYNAVPDILRYAWYMVWLQLKAAYHKYHAWAVLQGAKLDLYLAQQGNAPLETFSRYVVMRRYHHNISMRQNLMYRWRLWKGGYKEATAQPQGMQTG